MPKVSFAIPTNDLRSVKVRDFKFYREYFFKNSRIIVQKNKTLQRILFSASDQTLTLTQNANKAVLEFSIFDQKKWYHIFYSRQKGAAGKIGYFTVPSTKSFADKYDICYKENLKNNKFESLAKNLEEAEFVKLFDDKTCSKIISGKNQIDADESPASDLVSVLKKVFNPSSYNSLVNCLNKKSMQNILDKDQSLSNLASKALSEYLRVSEAIQNANSNLKIKCSLDEKDKGKLACFEKIGNQNIISIDFQNPATGKDFSNNAVVSLFRHEFFHSSESPAINSFDESNVSRLNCLCSAAGSETSESAITKICNAKISSTTEHETTPEQMKYANLAAATFGEAVTLTPTEIKVNQALQKVDKDSFAPVSASTIDHLANTTLQTNNGSTVSESNYGKLQTIFPSAKTSESLARVYNSMSNTAKTLSLALASSAAVAASATPKVDPENAGAAQASSRGISKSNPTTSSTNNLEIYSKAEIARDKYSADFNQPELNFPEPVSAQKNQRLASVETSTNSEANVVNSNKTPILNSKKLESSIVSSIAGSPPPSASPPQTQTAATGSQSSPNDAIQPTSSRSVASIPNSQKTMQTSFDNSILQTLNAFDKVGGKKYLEIRKMYSDANFANQLKQRRIRITVQNQDGRRTYLGSKDNSEINFIDDGEKLIKVENRKK